MSEPVWDAKEKDEQIGFDGCLVLVAESLVYILVRKQCLSDSGHE